MATTPGATFGQPLALESARSGSTRPLTTGARSADAVHAPSLAGMRAPARGLASPHAADGVSATPTDSASSAGKATGRVSLANLSWRLRQPVVSLPAALGALYASLAVVLTAWALIQHAQLAAPKHAQGAAVLVNDGAQRCTSSPAGAIAATWQLQLEARVEDHAMAGAAACDIDQPGCCSSLGPAAMPGAAVGKLQLRSLCLGGVSIATAPPQPLHLAGVQLACGAALASACLTAMLLREFVRDAQRRQLSALTAAYFAYMAACFLLPAVGLDIVVWGARRGVPVRVSALMRWTAYLLAQQCLLDGCDSRVELGSSGPIADADTSANGGPDVPARDGLSGTPPLPGAAANGRALDASSEGSTQLGGVTGSPEAARSDPNPANMTISFREVLLFVAGISRFVAAVLLPAPMSALLVLLTGPAHVLLLLSWKSAFWTRRGARLQTAGERSTAAATPTVTGMASYAQKAAPHPGRAGDALAAASSDATDSVAATGASCSPLSSASPALRHLNSTLVTLRVLTQRLFLVACCVINVYVVLPDAWARWHHAGEAMYCVLCVLESAEFLLTPLLHLVYKMLGLEEERSLLARLEVQHMRAETEAHNAELRRRFLRYGGCACYGCLDFQ
jgi:hypothetical protein